MAIDVFQAPGRIIFGWNSVEKVGEEALKFGSKALLVTGRNSSRVNGSLAAALTSLQTAGVAVTLFCEVDSDPCVQAITDGAARAGNAARMSSLLLAAEVRSMSARPSV